jgi:fructokinase
VILTCGEALVDLVATSCGESEVYVPRPGGSPSNVAVGLARLEAPAAFLGRVSTDRFGRLIRQHLGSNGVDLRYVRDGPERTALGLVHDSLRAEVEYTFYAEDSADRNLQPSDLPDALAEDVQALHFGSFSTALEPTASTLEGFIRREASARLVSFDPNLRPRLVGDLTAYRTRLGRLVAMADLVKLSAADAGWLYPHTPLATVARRWLELGPALVVITRGPEGSTAYGPGATASAPAVAVEVVDTVGAGDAFTAGSLAWLHRSGRLKHADLAGLSEPELSELLRYANLVAALTCTRMGADPPSRHEVAAAAGG